MKTLSICLLLSLCAVVSAAPTLTSLVGDKDGFDQGLLPGQGIDWNTLNGAPAENGVTDTWFYGTQSWTHTLNLADLDGPATSASLTIFHAGDGLYKATDLYVNGIFIGSLADVDDVGPAYNYTAMETFDLAGILGTLANSTSVTVLAHYSGDGWAMDFSELTVNSSGTVVPAPGAMLLASVGIYTVTWLRRRRCL